MIQFDRQTLSGDGINLSLFARGIALITCAVLVLLTWPLGFATGYGGVAVITLCTSVLLFPYSQQSIGAVLIFAMATLYVVPLISLIYVGEPVTLALFGLFAITAFLMAHYGVRSERWMVPPDGHRISAAINFLLTAALLAAGLVASALGGEAGQPIFTAFAAMALVNLERLHWAGPEPALRWAGLVLYGVAIAVYATFLWDGFGRIVLISFILLPVLLSVRYRLFRLSPLLLACGGGLLVFIGRVLRFGFSEGIAGISDDSGATHLILSSELLAHATPNTSGTNTYEQFLLFFTNWAPRSAWPAKPVNINSLFVDSYIGRAGYSQEHSTALGFFGEHVYLTGDMWFLTMIAAGVMVFAVRALLARIARPYYATLVVYDIWLVTLFWGGMASFAARAWFGLVPLVCYVLFFRIYLSQSTAAEPEDPQQLSISPSLLNPRASLHSTYGK